MSFLRRNREPEEAQAVPAQQQPPPAQPTAQEEESSGGLIGWLRDSYNGLYKVVLEPSMPKWATIILLLVGFAIGLFWAYVISPTIFYNANPNRLNEVAQQQWARMIAVGFDPGTQYGTEAALDLLDSIPNPVETIDALIADPNLNPEDREALQSLRAVVPEDFAGAEPIEPTGFFQQLLSAVLLPAILILVITPILFLLWRLLIYPNLVAPIVDRARQATDKEYAERRRTEQESLRVQKEQRRLRDEMAKQADDSELGKPIMQNLAIYTPNRQFDESYEIELPLDQGGDFLGQSGVVLAEAVDPDPVAVEMWLFDMFSQQNLKKIFVTPTGYSDPSIRSRLEADVDSPADVIVAEPGAVAMIESDKIKMQGKMVTVDFNSQGRFENFQMQVRAWQKNAGAPAPVAGGGLPEYDNLQFDPPPPMPSSQPTQPSGQSAGYGQQQSYSPPPQRQSYGSGYDPLSPPQPPQQPPQQQSYGSGYDPLSPPQPPQQPPQQQPPQPPQPPQQQSYGSGYDPLTPPPLNYPPQRPEEDDEDDPFGGTGDFTPLPKN